MTKTIEADSLYNEIEYGKIEVEEEERRPRNFQACLSLDLLKHESAGHSGALRSGETRPTISTRANKSRRFKC